MKGKIITNTFSSGLIDCSMEKKKNDTIIGTYGDGNIIESAYTDEWGVSYINSGHLLKEVNPQLFTC